jgi:hypothetical protein
MGDSLGPIARPPSVGVCTRWSDVLQSCALQNLALYKIMSSGVVNKPLPRWVSVNAPATIYLDLQTNAPAMKHAITRSRQTRVDRRRKD